MARYSFNALTGGQVGAVDAVSHTLLTVGEDTAAAVIPGGQVYFYEVIATTDPESSPTLIRPDSGGEVGWQLVEVYGAGGPGADQNYVSDADLIVIGNTSGANSGDQDLSSLATKAACSISGFYDTSVAYAPANGATVTHDYTTGNSLVITAPSTGTFTIAITNAPAQLAVLGTPGKAPGLTVWVITGATVPTMSVPQHAVTIPLIASKKNLFTLLSNDGVNWDLVDGGDKAL